MKLDTKDCINLCHAIITQAVDDYRYLVNRNIESGGNCDVGHFSKSELESFFKSDYCDGIIQDIIGLRRMTGMDFLKAAT